MKIIKKRIKDVVLGDILILDYAIIGKRTDVEFDLTGCSMKALKNKFEGETKVFLYEVDDIDEDSDGEEEDSIARTFYHITDIMAIVSNTKRVPAITFYSSFDLEIDVIDSEIQKSK